MSTKILLSLSLLLTSHFYYAQDPIQFDLILSGTTDENNLIPHTDSTELPDTLHIKGKIIESYKGICGDLCAGGTVKIELSEKVAGYPHWYVYAITTCYNGDAKEEELDFVVSKYTEKETICYYQKVVNIIDSGKIPYYKLSEEESLKIGR